jgi:RNA polymerase sigma-B factor
MELSSDSTRPKPSVAELFQAWSKRGDLAARAELIERHLPLAARLAARYVRDPQQSDDLVQVASVGLIAAVERFDPDRGFAFSSFAVPTILGELKRHFRDHGWSLHVDRRTQELAQSILEAQREFAVDGRAATVDALAKRLDCEPERVLEGLEASFARMPLSLDAPISRAPSPGPEHEESSLIETVGADDPLLERATDRVTLGAAFRHLPRIERRVVYLRFGEELSQREIATQVGVSQMHVSRLLRRALERLREHVTDTRTPALQARG